MGFAIHAQIASVDVGKQVRADSGVIQRGIEYPLVGIVVGGYVDLGQIVIPCASGSIAYAVKIPFGNFSAYVLLGSVASTAEIPTLT